MAPRSEFDVHIKRQLGSLKILSDPSAGLQLQNRMIVKGQICQGVKEGVTHFCLVGLDISLKGKNGNSKEI